MAGSGPFPKRGRFEYRCDGKPVPIGEAWVARHLGDNRQAVFSVRRLPGGGRLSAFVVLDVDIAYARFRLLVPDTAAHRTDYARTPDGWMITSGDDVMTAPALFLFPLMRCFTGLMIAALETAGGEADILVPWLHDPGDRGRLFTPDITHRHLDTGDRPDTITLTGGPYETGTRIRRDGNGFLADYAWTNPAGQTWSCRRLTTNTEHSS